MKNITFALAFASMAAVASAQEDTVPSKFSVMTNSFTSNWFVEGGISYNAAYTSQERGVTASPFTHKRASWGVNTAIGKWFTPEIALRTGVEYGWVRNTSGNLHSAHPSNNYLYIHQDVMMNLTHLLVGYDPNHILTMSPYAGIGFLRNFDENENKLGVSIGVRNALKVTNRMAVFADLQMLFTRSIFLGPKGNHTSNIFAFKHYDKIGSMKFGVVYDISKQNQWHRASDFAEIMALNREQMELLERLMNEERLENNRLREKLASAQSQALHPVETRVVKETSMLSTTYSVFFEHDSHAIASRKDLVDLGEVVAYAKANNKKLLVTGYADSDTGSADYNRSLSERRAQTLATELSKMGIPQQNIITKAAGGVDALSPYNYNRRATIELQ